MTTDIPDPLVIAICYRSEWWSEEGAFDAAVAGLTALGSVEVLELPYEEEHVRRSGRGTDPDRNWLATQPAIDPAVLAGFARSHVILALDLPVNICELAPDLKWVQAFGAGSDQFVSCRLGASGVLLTNSAGSNAIGIAEFALGRILEHAKRFPLIRERQVGRIWQATFGRELTGSTLGLIGFGNICAAVAPRARAFGMRVEACRNSARSGDTHELLDAVWPADQLHAMLERCDYVVAAVPNTPATDQLMNADAFAAMKPGAFFVNVGRGSLVDESALVAALESGHLGGAALDVVSTEPLGEDSPVWSAPNLALSFHNAAVPAAMFGNVHRIFADNVASYLAGGSLRNTVHQ